jgi:SAM-dependent methyltransferase
MTYRIFCEPSLGVVGHTASSRALAQDPTLGAYLANSLDEIAPAAYKMVEAMERWPGSQEPNEAGWNLAHNESRPMFEAVGADQKRAGRFANSMAWFHARPGLSVHHLTEEDSMKWETVKKVVDVGGGHGTVCSALVKRYPELQCVVQDLPQVVGSAQTLTNNLTFMAHDFFQEQPVKDADVYLLRWVLHDWSDLYAAKILRALIPALKPGSRLIINEFCFPEPGEISLYEQRFPRYNSP